MPRNRKQPNPHPYDGPGAPVVHVGDLRVWHIPQVPGEAFHVPVTSPTDAIRVMTILAEYDAFQFTQHVKPDYCNVAGLEVWDGDNWTEWSDAWTDDQNGDDIDQYAIRLAERAAEKGQPAR